MAGRRAAAYAERMPDSARPSLPVRWSSQDQQPPFVGRRADLAVLEEAWAAAAAGASRVVFVGGEPGAGKSRLAAEAARTFHDNDAIVLLGSCVAELGAPYEPFDGPIRMVLTRLRRRQTPMQDRGWAGDEAGFHHLLSAVAGRTAFAPTTTEPKYRRELYDAV